MGMIDDIRAYQHNQHFYTEAVTLTGQRTPDSSDDDGEREDAITKATRMPMSRALQIFGTVGLNGDETVFVLPAAEVINNVSPERNDVITDAASVTFQITNVREVNARSQWVCAATKRDVR